MAAQVWRRSWNLSPSGRPAALAAGYSKARNAGRVAVHMARGADVSKRRGQPPGEVTLERSTTVMAKPQRE